MTLAELLIVVAIVILLLAVAFVSVITYQRSLAQLQRDTIAKEIFVAAQNHLTAAKGQGYLNKTGYGNEGHYDEDLLETGISDEEKKVYYFVVNEGTVSGGKGEDAYHLMLPFGAIDANIIGEGSFLVRYQPETATVLDVFYCSTKGSPARFNHTLAVGEYSSVMPLTGDANKADRRTWTDGSVLGWYGGADAEALPTVELKAPDIIVTNAERLYVTIKDPNASINQNITLRLLITGELSGKSHYVTVYTTPTSTKTSYEVELDNITKDGGHFCERAFDDMTTETDNGFIPGENITVQAVAFGTGVLSNVVYSGKKTTNSLFADETTTDTAYIANFRHLENLDKTLSDLDNHDSDTNGKLNIAAAVQLSDLNWKTDDGGYWQGKQIVDNTGENSVTATDHYYPIEPNYALTYDGRSHSITGVKANAADAGLFGKVSVSTVSSISNLELIDFDITGKIDTGTTSAGALAGTLNGSTVTNVLARNSSNADAVNITSSNGSAGGLIGVLNGGTVQYSAAAVIVNGSTNAGGLIGSASGTITGCYAGGHTKTGSYEEWISNGTVATTDDRAYDVTGATAGGLVGTSSATISDSYSTCSVSGTTTAGGFAGTASGKITNSYATGYIDPNATTKYAFVAGPLPDDSTGNWYYRAINEVPKEGGKDGETEPMLPYSGYVLNSTNLNNIKPIDLNAGTYNTFVGAWDSWNPARAFDPALVQYYSGKYTLKTVDELNATATLPDIDNDGNTDYSSWDDLFVSTHYGDWPTAEIFFVNEKASS